MAKLKLPPQNIDAEKSVLGSILIDEEAIFKVADQLTSDNFYDHKHKLIFDAVLELYSKQKPIDILTISSVLKKNDKLKVSGGNAYLSELAETVPSTAHVEEYAKLIIDNSVRRKLISLSGAIEEMAYKEEEDLQMQLDEAEKNLLSIAQTKVEDDFIHVSTLLEESYKRAEELNKDPGRLRGIPTGFKHLDEILGGLQKSDLIILAARPSIGKTALAVDIARHASVVEKKSVGMFSLEMSDAQLMDRLLSMQVGVGLWDLRMGRISDDVFSRLSDAMGILAESNLFIDDTPSIGIMDMRAKARRLKVEKSLDLLVVDYLQLITGRRQESRVQEVSEISRFLKGLARELDIPVLAISQLSRAVEQRSQSQPQLSDLRDSGSIEQDADIVLFLSKNDSEEEAQSDNRLLTIAKHRNGPTGVMELYFIKEQARFRELDKVHK